MRMRTLIADTVLPPRPPIAGFWTWDIPGDRVVGCSRLIELFGFKEKEAAVGLPLSVYTQRIVDIDRDRVTAAISHAMFTRERFCETYHVSVPHGGRRRVRAAGRCQYDPAGRPTLFPGWIFEVPTASMTSKEEALEVASSYILEVQSIVRSVGEDALDYLLDNILEELEITCDATRKDVLRLRN